MSSTPAPAGRLPETEKEYRGIIDDTERATMLAYELRSDGNNDLADCYEQTRDVFRDAIYRLLDHGRAIERATSEFDEGDDFTPVLVVAAKVINHFVTARLMSYPEILTPLLTAPGDDTDD